MKTHETEKSDVNFYSEKPVGRPRFEMRTYGNFHSVTTTEGCTAIISTEEPQQAQ